jgi:Mrp family chromosome partitioning ATPase
MRDLLAEQSRLSLQLNQLRQRFGDNYSQVVSAQSNLQTVEDQINALLATYRAREPGTDNPLTPPIGMGVGGNRLSLPELRARETNIRALFEKVQAQTKALGQQDLQIRKLKGDQDAISKKLDETAARIDQLNLEATTSNRISILSYGERPTAPLPNRRLPMTGIIGLLGLAAGAGLVALRGLADRRVSSILHMQQLAPAIRVLGMLPVLPEDLTDPAQISLAAHCVHQIRNLLEAVPTPDKGRALAVTSPSAGDGKTSLTLALGLSFAASGSRTLVIDCDMVGGGLTRRLNAAAHRRIGSLLQRQGLLTEKQVKEALRVAGGTRKKFGEILVDLGYLKVQDIERALADQKETSVGLLDALSGEPLAACVTSVVMEGLFILPLGAAASDNTSQISAKALRRVIKDARSQFDFIIIDTGPILGSLEASVAAREADDVILAIARGASAPLVTRTVELLGTLGARLGGIVFNRATPGDVAHSNYGSTYSLQSLQSSNGQPRSRSEPRRPSGAPPRLGPVAAAVAAGGIGPATESAPIPHANGSAKKSPTKAAGNGSASTSDAASADMPETPDL